jgi:histidinol-phosphatase (PHP family)
MPDPVFPQDYHLHTRFSIDSEMEMEEACRQAIQLGLREICFTDHIDLVPGDELGGYFNPEDYFAELRRCRDQFEGDIVIRAGFEIGEAHRFAEEVRELTQGYPFDFVIGSLHWVGTQSVMEPTYFKGKSLREAYDAYFDELLVLVKVGDFDVVGHLDVPKRYAVEFQARFDPAPFEEAIRAVLRACIERGIGIEINTGTIRRTENDPSPSPEVVRWYREMGGEILTIGSDGHRPAHMAFAFDRALGMAREAGFTHLTAFERRRPRFVPIDQSDG